MDTEEAIRSVSSQEEGLSSSEASVRLEKNGKNKLLEAKKESLFVRFLKQLAEPMTIILLVAAAISAGLEIYEGIANHHWEFPADVVIILAVVLINAILGVFQESKAEKALEALQEMSKAQSKVLRDGKQVVVPSEDLVVGDIILLEAGDAVPADARIIECASMKIEEAALTGESVPVDKNVRYYGIWRFLSRCCSSQKCSRYSLRSSSLCKRILRYAGMAWTQRLLSRCYQRCERLALRCIGCKLLASRNW